MDWAIDVAKARGSGINSWGARHNRHVSDLASGHFNFRIVGRRHLASEDRTALVLLVTFHVMRRAATRASQRLPRIGRHFRTAIGTYRHQRCLSLYLKT